MKINIAFCTQVIACLFISLNCESRIISINNIVDKQALQTTLNKAADWQVHHFAYSKDGNAGQLRDFGIDAWTNATFYLGLPEEMTAV